MKKILFENYKAFAKGEIELRPLTLLLGANSSGKSSILHLFLMLEQTINNAENYAAALKANGHSINLGEDINILKDRNRSETLTLEFCIDPHLYLKSLRKELNILDAASNLSFLNYINDLYPGIIGKNIEPIDYQKVGSRTLDIMSKSISRINDFTHNSDSALYRVLIEGRVNKTNSIESLLGPIRDITKLEDIISSFNDCLQVFERVFSQDASSASIRFEFRYSKYFRKLKIRSCAVHVDNKTLIRITIVNNKTSLDSSVFSAKSLLHLSESFKPGFEFNGLSIKTKETKQDLFSKFITTLVEQAFLPVKFYFSKRNLKYVGPLRAYPQRYYFLDDSNINQGVDSQNGASLAEILKKNPSVKKKINKWMEKFGLSVDVKEFKDVIHNIKVTHNGLVLDIPDVGFGVSQVLPILVEGMIAPAGSTTIMEQPEIHLHPKMQAELADFFIEMLNLGSGDNNTAKSLIIETHSEYLLKRIRRRIAEGIIRPEDVAIYFIKSRDEENLDSALIEMSDICDDGTIEWPRDFYITEWEDELAFFKLKSKKS